MTPFFMSKRDYILNWIHEVSKIRPELGGFAVCPYAKSALYEIIDTNVGKIEPVDGYDVVIFIIEDELELDEIRKWVKYYNIKHQDWKFFEDCGLYSTFINGIQTNNRKYNLILAQPKQKLRKFREKLAKTEYYSYWDHKYLNEILGDDYDIITMG